MLSRLKTLFKRENKLDPLAAQRERLMETSRRETCESARHDGPRAPLRQAGAVAGVEHGIDENERAPSLGHSTRVAPAGDVDTAIHRA